MLVTLLIPRLNCVYKPLNVVSDIREAWGLCGPQVHTFVGSNDADRGGQDFQLFYAVPEQQSPYLPGPSLDQVAANS